MFLEFKNQRWYGYNKLKHCILTRGNTKTKMTTIVHDFMKRSDDISLTTAWKPCGCVTTSVNYRWATSLLHRHKEMEEQFIASLCRIKICYQKHSFLIKQHQSYWFHIRSRMTPKYLLVRKTDDSTGENWPNRSV